MAIPEGTSVAGPIDVCSDAIPHEAAHLLRRWRNSRHGGASTYYERGISDREYVVYLLDPQELVDGYPPRPVAFDAEPSIRGRRSYARSPKHTCRLDARSIGYRYS